jgi:hypothetical protein
MDVLVRIKRLVFQGRVRYTDKAIDEMAADGLEPSDVEESILNAQMIEKTLRSRSRLRWRSAERLYVIKSFSYTGTLIYTKGKIDRRESEEFFYVFVSAKIATVAE